jgi:hypothetical protein
MRKDGSTNISAKKEGLTHTMVSHAGSAVAAGIVDMKSADPIEGILLSQLVVANEAAESGL